VFIQSYLAFCSIFPKVEQIMESHAQSVEDNLIDSLSFKLHPGASYVTDRRSVSFFPQGGNQYTSNGVKVCKISLNGDQWLDPSSVKLFYNITNTTQEPIPDGTNPNTHVASLLQPLVAGPWGFFRRMRVICGGQIVEDIDNYNRLHEMVHMMKPSEKRINDAIEGFGVSETSNLTIDSADSPSPLPKGQKRTVCFTPLSGLLSQEKFLPIRYCPIQLEFEIVGSASDAVQGAQSSLGKSESFLIDDVQLKCDLVQLDNSLDNEYAQHLLSGKSLPINFSSFTCASQVLTDMNTTVNVQRSFTRMKSVFVSLYNQHKTNPSNSRKEVNNFWHPMGATAYDHSKEVEFQMQIGSKLFPEYPIRSLAEAFYQLRKTLGINSSNAQMNMVHRYYRDHKFVIGLDTEKLSGASFSGMNTRSGDLLNLRMKSVRDGEVTLDLANYTYKLFYMLQYDAILQVNDTGVSVLE
jgi:hypothetical protein